MGAGSPVKSSWWTLVQYQQPQGHPLKNYTESPQRRSTRVPTRGLDHPQAPTQNETDPMGERDAAAVCSMAWKLPPVLWMPR